jgi:formylmethanofuran dehydrogenase subunit E
MAKILAAQARLFKNIFVCKECKSKIRAEPIRVINGKVKCRKCKSKKLRPIRKK